jgi:two-component system, NarL family, sensor kinase
VLISVKISVRYTVNFLGFILVVILYAGCNNSQAHSSSAKGRPPGAPVVKFMNEAVQATDSVVINDLFSKAFSVMAGDSDRKLIAVSYDRIGVAQRNKSNYQQALFYHSKALELARILDEPLLLCSVLNNMGVVYRRMDENTIALDYHMEALKIAESMPDTRNTCISLNSIGNIHIAQNSFSEALGYFRKALGMEKQRNNQLGVAINLNNIGSVYEGLRFYDSAHYYYNASLEQNKAIKQKIGEAICYNALAGLYTNEGKYKDALLYLNKAIELNLALGDRIYLSESYGKVAAVYQKQQQYQEAETYYQKSLSIASEIGSKWQAHVSYQGLSDIYKQRGDYEMALTASQKSVSLRDTIMNEKNLQHILNIQNKYEAVKQSQEIALLKKEKASSKFQMTVLGIGLLLLGIIFYGYYRNLFQKNKIINQLMEIKEQKIRELETEKLLTATEAVLKGEEQERTRLARDLHDGLGGMLSGIKYSFNKMKGNLVMTGENMQAFERSMDMLDSSIKEMRRVAHNMMPEALVKFGLDTALKDFCNDINQSGALQVSYQSIGLDALAIEQSTAITIYRVVQELINNTMRHAVAKSAIVQVSKTGSLLSVTVEDDGKGFDPEILKSNTGIGWTNIKSRVDYLKGTIDVQASPGKGTSVHLEFIV